MEKSEGEKIPEELPYSEIRANQSDYSAKFLFGLRPSMFIHLNVPSKMDRVDKVFDVQNCCHIC